MWKINISQPAMPLKARSDNEESSGTPIQTDIICPLRLHTVVCTRAQSCLTPWTTARQAPRSLRLSRQEYWSGLPFPAPGDLPNPGIEPRFLVSPALVGGFFTTCTTWEGGKVTGHF